MLVSELPNALGFISSISTWEHLIILEKTIKHTFRKEDYQFQSTEKYQNGSCIKSATE